VASPQVRAPLGAILAYVLAGVAAASPAVVSRMGSHPLRSDVVRTHPPRGVVRVVEAPPASELSIQAPTRHPLVEEGLYCNRGLQAERGAGLNL
jgi:hypothetical protein